MLLLRLVSHWKTCGRHETFLCSAHDFRQSRKSSFGLHPAIANTRLRVLLASDYSYGYVSSQIVSMTVNPDSPDIVPSDAALGLLMGTFDAPGAALNDAICSGD